MDLSMLGFGFGMASIFGLIVGIFSVWNGRMTRREISEYIKDGEERTAQHIKETQALIKEMHTDTQALIKEMRTETQNLINESHRETRELIASEKGEFRRLFEKMDNKISNIETKIQA